MPAKAPSSSLTDRDRPATFAGKLQAFLGGDGESRRAITATLTALTLKILSAACAFLFTYMIARRFGAYGSGIFGIAATVMAIVTVLTSLGLDFAATRQIAGHATRNEWPQVRAGMITASLLTLGVGGAVTAAAILAAPLLAASFGKGEDLADAIAVLSLAALALAWARLYAASLRGLHKLVAGNSVDPFLTPALMALFMAVLPIATIHGATLAYTAASLIAAGVGLAAWQVKLAGRGRPRGPLLFRRALFTGLPIFGTVIGGFVTPWVVVLAVGYFATVADAGIYRVATQFALLLAFVLQSAESGLAPQFASLKAQGALHRIGPAARRTSVILALFGVVPGIIILLFSNTLLSLFGHEFTAGALALRILICGQIIQAMLGPVGQLMIMTGLDRYSLVNSLIGAVLVTILSVVLIPRFGIEGAAIAAAVTGVWRALAATAIVWLKHGIFLPLGLVRRP